MKDKQIKRVRSVLVVLTLILVVTAFFLIFTRKQGSPVIVLEQEQPASLLLYRYDGEETQIQEFDAGMAQALVTQINLQPATQLDTPEDATRAGVLYGLSIPQEGDDFQALLLDGVWFTSLGECWQMKLDLDRVWELGGGTPVGTCTLYEFPNIRALAQQGENWNTQWMLSPRYTTPETQELTLKVLSLDEETGVMRLSLSNETRITHSVTMKFSLEVQVDGAWYQVPPQGGAKPHVEDAGYDVTAHLPITLSPKLGAYLPLPAGTYRMTNTAENIYGLTPDVMVSALFYIE